MFAALVSKVTFIKIVNFIQFQVIWFLCVIYKIEYIGISIVLFLIYLVLLYYMNRNRFITELKIIVACAVAGYIGDTILMHVGIFKFRGDPVSDYLAPAWLAMIWIAFASTVNSSMRYLSTLPPMAQALLGAIVGPAVYFFSKKYTHIDFSNPFLTHYVIYMLYWGAIIPLFFYIKFYFLKHK